MKVSINWLRQYVDLENISADAIAEKLTLHTCEVEEVVNTADFFDHVFAGVLVEIKKHSNSEKLSIGIFDCGKLGNKQIIFGQVFPLVIGEIYPVALAGAALKSGIKIENSEIRGEKSAGMVCTNQELGMKNEGFIRLKDKNLAGKALSDIFDSCNDTIIDIDNKSLTHRPDLMGHRGIAREISAIFGRPTREEFNLLTDYIPDENESIQVDIQTPYCRRFCAAKVANVSVKNSDTQTQISLENLDTRAISNIVDITNLILNGHGQPMHAFDSAKIAENIIIRMAKNGESIVALDGETYELTHEDIVIADAEKILSIAGIMGGLESAVTDTTTDIVFESANFDPTVIRKTSQRLGLRSESSGRYEKSLDAEQCLPALIAAIALTKASCPEAKSSAITDIYPVKNTEIIISLDPQYVRRHSGLDLSDETIEANLISLGFNVVKQQKNFLVTVPSWRATKDISISEDLIEEIVRLYGFSNIKAKLPKLSINPPQKNVLRAQDWKIRDTCAHQGYREVYHSSFVGPLDHEFTERDDYVTIANPSNDECTFLRQTLVSNYVRDLKSELRTHEELNFFELGKTYRTPQVETPQFILFSAQLKGNTADMFYDMKSQLITVFENLGIEKSMIEFRPAQNPAKFMHPYMCADVIISGTSIGTISALHPEKNNVKNSSIVFAEIETIPLQKIAGNTHKKYKQMSSFPVVYRDISVLLDSKVLVGDLIKSAYAASKFLTNIELFDDFSDAAKFGDGIKNLAFHLSFRSEDKTLNDEDIESAFEAINKAWSDQFNSTIRT